MVYSVLDRARTTPTTKAKSTNYTVDMSDKGATIRATASLTLSLTAAATLGVNFTFELINASNSPIIIDPNSSETINGLTTLKVFPGEHATIVCDGTNWNVFGLAPLVLLASNVVSTVTSTSFVSLFDAAFNSFEIRASRLVYGSGNSGISLRASINAGSSWLSGASDYSLAYFVRDEGGTFSSDVIVDSLANICQISSGSMSSFEMELFDLNSVANFKTTQQRQAGAGAGGLRIMSSSARLLGATSSVVNGIQFFVPSGNMSGIFNLYGRR